MITAFIIACLLLLFGAVVFRGAPYVPTLGKTADTALDMLNLQEGEVVVDLGSGDGIFLKKAAKRGQTAIGYEINPILCVIAWGRCWRQRNQVSVRWRDFWLSELPPETKGVYVFLAGPYMNRFKRKIEAEMKKRTEPLRVVSNGFAIPGYLPKKISQGLYLYEFKP
ncbi:MAG: class I SAM-dependent methyltransferase [Candidatus Saccharimonadales bacterium]